MTAAPAPAWAQAKELHERAAGFYRRAPESRSQERYSFEPAWLDPELSERLAGERGSVCWYCQSPNDGPGGQVSVGHFRPPDGALSQTQELAPDHYWWLAYDESNLLLICEDCASRKGNRFPVENVRGDPDTATDVLQEEERPLVLHPGMVELDEHVAYDRDGRVNGTTKLGLETIAVLQLNRSWLVEARADAYRESLADSRSAGEEDEAWIAAEDAYDVNIPWYGVRRQAYRDERYGESFFDELDEVDAATIVTKSADQVKEAKAAQVAFDASIGQADVTMETRVDTARMIEKIVIHQFRIIDHLELQLQGTPGEWRMLLGENGSGKSTVLQAVALTLIDADYRNQLELEPRRFVRRGCKSGYVEITLSATPEPVRLEFTLGDAKHPAGEWGGTADDASAYVLGYGATRLLPRPGARRDDASSLSRAANLFDPFVALSDADAWLVDAWHYNRPRFNAAARALSDLLGQHRDARLRVVASGGDGEMVELRESGVWKSLDQLSDGYQTVVALALDIMAVLSDRFEDMKVAEGVVVLDELGSHLHPRWQLRIVSALRHVFPKLQFLATTHNPLCLRGLEPGEIVLMRHRRDTVGRVVAVTDLPDLSLLRVDQMLTSPHFGLGTTLDADTEGKYRRMYELQSMAGPSGAEQDELRELERDLLARERLGDTAAHGELYRAINIQLLQEAKVLESAGEQSESERLGPVVDILNRINRDRERNARRGALLQREGEGLIS